MTTTSQSLAPEALLAVAGDPGYAAAVATYNLAAPLHPALATTARSADDVRAAVRTARRAGRSVRVQTTGHAAPSQAPMQGAVLIRTALAGPVRVDPARRTAHVPAGARWNDVVAAAAPHGLAALHGSAGTVGAVGYLLRGGLSLYGRQFGVAANHVRSITLVLADGEVVTASADREPALFWALRGGGGGFGVVTEVEVDLVPMASVITGALFWDAHEAHRIAPLWREWTLSAPSAATTTLRLMNLPPLPGVPEQLTHGQVLVLDGAVLVQQESDLPAASAVAADLLEPLRAAAAAPLLDTWHVGSPADVPLTHMDPPDPLPAQGEHALLRDPGEAGLAHILAAAGLESGSTLVATEIRQLGGAFRTPTQAGGAFDRMDADLLYVGLGLDVPGLGDLVRADLARMVEATAPWRTGFTAPTFVESRHHQQRTFGDATAARVAAIREAVDPDGMFAADVSPIRDTVAV